MASPHLRKSAFKAIALGGLLSGLFDLLFAFVYYGNRGATPVGILHSIATGLIGKTAAYQGGTATAVLGIALHFLISFTAATAYWLASQRLTALIKHAVPCGLLYGAAIYFFMNMVILPLSAYHSRAFPPALAIAPIAIHVLGVGLTIALAARKYSSI